MKTTKINASAGVLTEKILEDAAAAAIANYGRPERYSFYNEEDAKAYQRLLRYGKLNKKEKRLYKILFED